MILGYRWNRLFEPILVAGSKLLLTEFGILHILESCDGDSLISRCQVPTSFNSPQNVPNKSLISANSQTCLCAYVLYLLFCDIKWKSRPRLIKNVYYPALSQLSEKFLLCHTGGEKKFFPSSNAKWISKWGQFNGQNPHLDKTSNEQKMSLNNR